MAQSFLDLFIRTKKTGSGEKEATTGLQNLAKSFQSLTGINLGAAAAFGAVAGAIKFSIDASADHQRVMAQTESAIKATGGAAGFTTKEIEDLARAEELLTGIDGDVIQTGQNMLLTFKGIGQETFPRATRAMEDLAVAMAGGDLSAIDLKGTAIQLGKALNDPILGVTALTRVGVTFTEEQKAAIKEMVEMNDVAGAQALILDELESEFGGAAEAAGKTFAGDVQRLKNELGGLGEVVGDDIIPLLSDMLSWITKNLIQMQEFSDILADHRSGVIDTSGTYEEYIAKQDELRQMAGRASAAVVDMTEDEFNARQETDNMIDTRRESIDQLDVITSSTDDYSLALEDNEAAAEAAKEEQKRLKDAFSDLQTIIDGPVSDAYDDFMEKQSDLQGKVNDLRGEIAELEAQEYLTDEQETRLGELQTELGETETSLVDLAEQHEDTIEHMIFGMAAEALARDGWQEGEIAALTELGLKWGIYDEATAAAMLAVESAVSGFNESGDMDTLISDLDNAKRSAEDLSGTYTINLVTKYSSQGDAGGWAGIPGGIKSGKQHGGPVYGGESYRVGEAGPETLVLAPGSSGYVIPNGGNTNNFYMTANYGYQSESSLARDVRMLEKFYGRS